MKTYNQRVELRSEGVFDPERKSPFVSGSETVQ